MSERLPFPDPARFPRLDEDASWVRRLPARTLIARIFRGSGAHPTRWHEFRTYGPLDARFDPHPEPTGEHPGFGVLYGAVEWAATPAGSQRSAGSPGSVGSAAQAGALPESPGVSPLAACVLEVFQQHRVIDRLLGDPTIAAFETTRPLRLLDLADSDWLSAAGGNAAIMSGARLDARAWSRAIFTAYPELDGIWSASSVIPPARITALFSRAEDALPTRPGSLIELRHPELSGMLEEIAQRYGFALV